MAEQERENGNRKMYGSLRGGSDNGKIRTGRMLVSHMRFELESFFAQFRDPGGAPGSVQNSRGHDGFPVRRGRERRWRTDRQDSFGAGIARGRVPTVGGHRSTRYAVQSMEGSVQ